MAILALIAVHVTLILFAFGMLVFPGFVAFAVAKSRDVRATRVVCARVEHLSKIGGPLVMAAAIFGFIAAIVEGIPLTSSWLVVAYVMYVALFAIGTGVYGRFLNRLGAAAAASPDDAPSAEFTALIDRGIPAPVTAIHHALWVGLIAVMFFKPHFW